MCIMVHEHTKLVEWTVPEYEQKKRSNDWFWGVGLIAVAGVVVSAIFGNFLLAVLLCISGLLLIVFARHSPAILHVEISEQGVQVNSTFHAFTAIKSFWVIDRNFGMPKLILNFDRRFNTIVSIPIHPDIPLAGIRNIMLTYSTEEETAEPFAEQFTDVLGL